MSRVQLAVLGKRVASASLTTIQSQRRKKKKKRSHMGLASLYTQGREHVSSLRGSGTSRRTDHRERAASALRATVTHPIHRRMPLEVKEEVRRLTAAGVTARQI